MTPPTGPFDLIHARLVLVHVTERDAALRTLAGALAPGGWLVIEDADPSLQPLAAVDPERGDAADLANRVRSGFRALLT
jgi:chemotaxis methyl-accepting protein methylase